MILLNIKVFILLIVMSGFSFLEKNWLSNVEVFHLCHRKTSWMSLEKKSPSTGTT